MFFLASQLITMSLFLMSTTHRYIDAIKCWQREEDPMGWLLWQHIALFYLMTEEGFWDAGSQVSSNSACILLAGTAAGLLGHAVCDAKEAGKAQPPCICRWKLLEKEGQRDEGDWKKIC